MKERCKLGHSFSDMSQFEMSTKCPRNHATKPMKLKGLRADYVHLQGVGLRSKSPLLMYPHSLSEETREGFRFRSIHRSMSSVESALPNIGKDDKQNTKTIVVVPSIDLDRKELNRMCDW